MTDEEKQRMADIETEIVHLDAKLNRLKAMFAEFHEVLCSEADNPKEDKQ